MLLALVAPIRQSAGAEPGVGSPPTGAERLGLLSLQPGHSSRDAAFGPLAEALRRPPAPLTLLALGSLAPEEVPGRLRRAGLSGALWARLLDGGRLGLRYYRLESGELFEAELPMPLGPPDAVGEAVWLRVQDLMRSPAGTGRAWPPTLFAAPAPTAEAIAARLAPPHAALPPMPDIVLPPPPAPRAVATAPSGDVEVLIEALPGAKAPAMMFSATAEHGALTPKRPAAVLPSPEAQGEPPILFVSFVSQVSGRPSLGGGLAALAPLSRSPLPNDGGSLALEVGFRAMPLHPADSGPLGPAGQVTPLRLDLGAVRHLPGSSLSAWLGGGLSGAMLTTGEGATATERYQLGLRGSALAALRAGPVWPSLGVDLFASPWTLSAATDGGSPVVVGERLAFSVVLGLGWALAD